MGSRDSVSGELKDGGFTLLELLIVMVILGIVAGIVVFAVSDLNKETAAAACMSDYKTVETAEAAYQTRNNGEAGSFTALIQASWLKEQPSNSNGYQISIDQQTGNVAVQSFDPAHSAEDGNANCAYA